MSTQETSTGLDALTAQYGRAGRPKVADAIISDIRGAIAAGQLPLGSRLPNERELAKRFGVSQPTVREATRALEAMGLVQVQHGRGSFVTGNVNDFVFSTLNTLLQVQHVDVIQALDVREVLGLLSASLAPANHTDQDLAAMEMAAAGCRAAKTIPEMSHAVVAFHVACSAAARNPLLFALESFLAKIIMELQIRAEQDRDTAFWRRQVDRFEPRRAELLACIRRRDRDASVSAMQAYLDDQRELFSQDSDFAQAKLSDPFVVSILRDMLLDVPQYRKDD